MVKKGRHNRRRLSRHKTGTPAEQAIARFKTYYDPKREKPLPVSGSAKKVTKPKQSPGDTPTKSFAHVSSAPSQQISKQSIAPASITHTQARPAVSYQAQWEKDGTKISEDEEVKRCAEAKPVRAIVLRCSHGSGTPTRTDPARALVRWRRRRLRCWLRALPFGTWARYGYIFSTYAILIATLVLTSFWAIHRTVLSDQSSSLPEQEQRSELKKKASGDKSKKVATKYRRNLPHQRGEASLISEDIRSDNEIGESLTNFEPLSLSDNDSKRVTVNRSVSSSQAQLPKPTSMVSTKEADIVVSLPRGTVIPVVLEAPVRSAYGTMASARVTSDVCAAGGQIAIRAGSLVQIPLSAPDAQGRFFSDPNSSSFITLTVEKTVPIKVFAQSPDGAGIQGKIRKTGALSRLLRGVAESGIAIGQEFGVTREAAQALQDSIPERGVNQSHLIGELKAGTRFALVVR